MNEPTLIIGWDGAPFAKVNEWIAEGELTNIAEMSREGYFGPLDTVPYVMSPCAWSTFLTGQNAGNHGIFDFYSNEFRDGQYFREPIDANSRQSPELWKLLNEQDISVGLINVPVTYPADDLDGFMISGCMSPSPTDDDFVKPEGFVDGFDDLDEYQIDLDVGKEHDTEEFLSGINEMVEKRAELIQYCIEESTDLDVLLAVFTAPDRLSHYYWHYEDETHPYRVNESKEELETYHGILLDLFRNLDQKVGEIATSFDEKYGSPINISVVSDHGMDSLENMFFVNQWLSEQGYLTFTDDPDEVNEEELPSEKKYVFGEVNWDQTQAYSIGKAGEIYINVQGREPSGSVDPDNYDEVRDTIASDLQKAVDPRTGKEVVDSVVPNEQLFDGPYVGKAPDLLITMVDGYYSLGYLYKEKTFMRNTEEDSPFVTGIEDRAGVLCQSGPAFRDAKDEAQIGLIDYLPTLMHALGLEVPENMDGNVVERIFGDKYMSENEIMYRQESLLSDHQEQTKNKETADSVKERLKNLGYF